MASADPLYAVLSPADVAGTNFDDDSAGIGLSQTLGLTDLRRRRQRQLHGGPRVGAGGERPGGDRLDRPRRGGRRRVQPAVHRRQLERAAGRAGRGCRRSSDRRDAELHHPGGPGDVERPELRRARQSVRRWRQRRRRRGRHRGDAGRRSPGRRGRHDGAVQRRPQHAARSGCRHCDSERRYRRGDGVGRAAHLLQRRLERAAGRHLDRRRRRGGGRLAERHDHPRGGSERGRRLLGPESRRRRRGQRRRRRGGHSGHSRRGARDDGGAGYGAVHGGADESAGEPGDRRSPGLGCDRGRAALGRQFGLRYAGIGTSRKR